MSSVENDTSNAPARLLSDTSRQASRTLRRERASVRDYVRESTDRNVVLKYEGASLDPEDKTDHMTSTAFFLSRIERSSGASSGRLSSDLNPLSEETLRKLAITLEEDFEQVYLSVIDEDGNIARLSKAYLDTSPLGEKKAGNPWYSMSLHLRGLASALKIQHHDTALATGTKVTKVLASDLAMLGFRAATSATETSNDKSISLLIEGKANWYITYLIVDALASWYEIIQNTDNNSHYDTIEVLKKSLRTAYECSVVGLSRMLALHSASHENDFDALELASCLAVVLRSASSESLQDIQSTAIARRAIMILVNEFVHADGTFSPKNPPLVDQEHTQLFVSSAEVAELTIDAAKDHFSIDTLAALATTVRLVCERSRGHRGWGRDGAGSTTRASIFDACSSIAFLTRFVDTWERLQAESVGKTLGLGLAPTKQTTFPLPDAIRNRILTKTINPIKEGRRDLASMSLLLYGAPGTAKTTIAKRIAAELGWPLLSLDPSKLMASGVDGIAAEADSLFRLLPGLRDVVVLFDEFEGVFLNRATTITETSRFLTTAMLPRLHELRDAGKIVFVIATNDRNAIDPAAYRPGRIDEHIEIEAPDVHSAGKIVSSIANRTVPRSGTLESWRDFWDRLINDKNVTAEIGGLTPAYLSMWVRTVAIDYEDNEDCFNRAVRTLSELKKRHSDEVVSYNGNRHQTF